MQQARSLSLAPPELEEALKSFLFERPLPLYRMMAYQLGWVNEHGEEVGRSIPPRPHGTLCLVAANTLGADSRASLPYAMAIELLHNFWQIHGDVEDGNTERNGRPSVWWTWGPAQAINAGDGMHALARLALFQLRLDGAPPERIGRAVQALDEATLLLCEGEYMDITFQERISIDIAGYLQMAAARSGAIMACALRLGGLAADVTDDRLGALADFGRSIGTALQIAGDYEALWGAGTRDQTQQGRLLAKKKNLPVAHAIESQCAAVRRALGEMYMKRVLDPESIPRLAELLDESGSKQFTVDKLQHLLEEAEAALAAAGLAADRGSELRAAARSLLRPSA